MTRVTVEATRAARPPPGWATAQRAVFYRLGLLDTYLGGILPVAVFPLIILLVKLNFDQLGLERLLRSARMDGASELQILVFVALPIARPAIVAAGIFTFLYRLRDLYWPLVVFPSEEMFTVTEFLLLNGGAVVPAAAVLTAFPAVLVFALQRYMRGVLSGAVE